MFIQDSLARHVAVALVSLVSGLVTWWSGRSLLAILDDPVLPERLLAYRKRNRLVLWTALMATMVIGDFTDLLWAVPLTIGARLVAGYSLRRRLFDERWSLAAYASCMMRLLLAVSAFRLLLLGAPLVASAAGSLDWLAALVLGAVLLVWDSRSAEIFRWLLRSKPLADDALLARFRAIAAASHAPDARFELVDFEGGAIANALALPSLRGSSVLYSDTLLRLLDADEAAAITAHEIAHLEYFDRARLRRMTGIMRGLILGATGCAMLPRLAPIVSTTMVAPVWAFGSLMVLAWMVRDRQKNETASDVRAVALCGDAEALVRALTKVYQFSRMPRRYDTQTEQAASHPSLARRIRSIREAAGTPPPATLPQPETVHAIGGQPVITFEADRLQWQESEGIVHVLSYAQLTELRVYVRAARGTRLVALERGGRRWEAELDAANAARAQAILDRVDGRLAEPPMRMRTMPLLQAAGAIVAISAMWVGHIVVAIVAIGASTRSAAAFFAAAGAGALGAAGIVARQAIATGDAGGAWPALVLAVFGVALLAGAWRQRADASNRMVDLGVAGLAVLAIGSLAVIAISGRGAVRLYQASVAIPSAAILPLALAAALACKPRRAWRLAAVPLILVGLMVGLAGSGTFLYAFGSDPFLVAAPRLETVTLTGEATADFTVPGAVLDLRLSPSGRRVAVRKYAGGPGVVALGRAVTNFSVGAPGKPFATIAADDLVFLDDEHVLAIVPEGANTRVRKLTVRSAAVEWETAIDDVLMPRLAYRSAEKRWIATGTTATGQIVSVHGTIDGSDVRRRDWDADDRVDPTDTWAIDGDALLVAHRTFGFDLESPAAAWSLALTAMLQQSETRLTRIGPGGAREVITSQLEATCSDRLFGGARLVCTAFDGARTQVLAFDPAGHEAQPIGSLAGSFIGYRNTDGWLSGWSRAGGLMSGPTRMAVDLAGRRAIVIDRDAGADEIVGVGRVAATLHHSVAGTRIRLYNVE